MGSEAPSRWRTAIDWGLLGTLGVLAALHLAITLSTLLAYTLRHPMQDEFRLNLRYLTVPFPLSVLELENGHRPIFPGIARYIELTWLHGVAYLQTPTAWGAAAFITLVLARESLGCCPRLPGVAALCLACTLLWWNANARMFIHVYEATHLFYIAFGLVVALLCAHKASVGPPTPRRIAWWCAAIAACVFATFSFGPGFAAFAALLVAATLLRRKATVFAVIVAAAAITVSMYAFVLPGAAGVGNSKGAFSPGAWSYVLVARLAAPAYELLARARLPEQTQLALALPWGVIVLLVPAGSVVRRWWRREHFDRLEILALGLFSFGVVANALITANRTEYFAVYPGQLFADRYLFWSCVTWLGAGLYGLARLGHAGRRAQVAGASAVAMLAIAAMPGAMWYKGWSAEVYRRVELAAAGLTAGLRDDARVLPISGGGLETTYLAVEAMRAAGTGGFGQASSPRLGQVVRVRSAPANSVAIIGPGSTDGMIVGRLPRKTARRLRKEPLWLAAADGTLLGTVAITSSGAADNWLRIRVPTLDRFEGYLMSSRTPAQWLGRIEDDGTFVVIAEARQRQRPPGTSTTHGRGARGVLSPQDR